jgi:hypothetical protein
MVWGALYYQEVRAIRRWRQGATLTREGIIFMIVSCAEVDDQGSTRLYLLGVSRGVILMSLLPAAPWSHPQKKRKGGGKANGARGGG